MARHLLLMLTRTPLITSKSLTSQACHVSKKHGQACFIIQPPRWLELPPLLAVKFVFSPSSPLILYVWRLKVSLTSCPCNIIMKPSFWTNDCDILVENFAAYGSRQHGEHAKMIKHTHYIDGSPAFPTEPSDVKYANDRKQKAVRKSKHIDWKPPTFPPGLYARLQPNPYIDKLYKTAMQTRRTKKDDASILSFDNENGFVDDDDDDMIDDVLSKALTKKVTISPARGRGAPRGGTQSKFAQAVDKLLKMHGPIRPLYMGASKNPIEHMVVSVSSSRKSDDGKTSLRALRIEVPVLSVRDVSKVSVQIICFAYVEHINKLCSSHFCFTFVHAVFHEVIRGWTQCRTPRCHGPRINRPCGL